MEADPKKGLGTLRSFSMCAVRIWRSSGDKATFEQRRAVSLAMSVAAVRPKGRERSQFRLCFDPRQAVDGTFTSGASWRQGTREGTLL